MTLVITHCWAGRRNRSGADFYAASGGLEHRLSLAGHHHARGESALAPIKLLTNFVDALSPGASLTFGLAGLPHILKRLITVKNGVAAFVARDPRYLDPHASTRRWQRHGDHAPFELFRREHTFVGTKGRATPKEALRVSRIATMVLMALAVYFSFLLTIAFSPQSLPLHVGDQSLVTTGIVTATRLFCFSAVGGGIYVWIANRTVEPLASAVVEAGRNPSTERHRQARI